MPYINLTLLNVRSVNNKTTLLSELIQEKQIDLFAITETLLQEGDTFVINELCPPGYNYLGLPRVTSRGGGLGLVFKEEYDVSLYSKLDVRFKSFEFLPIKVKVTYEEFLLVILYRPPPSPKKTSSQVPCF